MQNFYMTPGNVTVTGKIILSQEADFSKPKE
jgi:hypothetical protein